MVKFNMKENGQIEYEGEFKDGYMRKEYHTNGNLKMVNKKIMKFIMSNQTLYL